jgi:hypothetical protein
METWTGRNLPTIAGWPYPGSRLRTPRRSNWRAFGSDLEIVDTESVLQFCVLQIKRRRGLMRKLERPQERPDHNIVTVLGAVIYPIEADVEHSNAGSLCCVPARGVERCRVEASNRQCPGAPSELPVPAGEGLSTRSHTGPRSFYGAPHGRASGWLSRTGEPVPSGKESFSP